MRIASIFSLALLTACLPGGGSDIGSDGENAPDVEPEPDPEPEEYGPENSWWHALAEDVPGDLEGTGFREGDIAYNFTAVDQYGDEVELYQFHGQVIVLDMFAEW
ncbi:MAG: hypothetical protein GY913_35400 [Proteobacteria bacterium]|nr:hypothetical protein [Pseudomonadota bacterium]